MTVLGGENKLDTLWRLGRAQQLLTLRSNLFIELLGSEEAKRDCGLLETVVRHFFQYELKDAGRP
jgi:hypothetical protein